MRLLSDELTSVVDLTNAPINALVPHCSLLLLCNGVELRQILVVLWVGVEQLLPCNVVLLQ